MRISDVIYGRSNQCKACAAAVAWTKIPPETRLRNATKASKAAAQKLKARPPSKYEKRYGAEALAVVLSIGSGAKQRCTNPNDAAWVNYGSRGIEFRFGSVRDFAKWVLDNIGPRPTPNHSIDRIDNNRHYERGNLRWATREEQARNKRPYNGNVYGRRMARLMKLRPDYTYEGLRKYVKLGYSDEQIATMQKPKGGRPRKARSSV